MITRPLAWRKSSYSGNTGGDCVEVAIDGALVFIRDSKYRRVESNDPAAEPTIIVKADQWSTFLGTITNRMSASTELTIEVDQLGGVNLCAAEGTTLRFTPDEWAAFTAGVLDGEFDHQALAA
ncbi:DUF397 domain-containing protein [Nocardia sp. XZ_19_369]|uniref:DUF397 domain-containing protein n=1 Tax=Nocardia sp. XZ_19_369 TaxID=2769487 RepID=UPI00188E6A6D|nr:DUF397 domain-containing protein [Nocardia sp. XZ_19_369]